MSATRKVPVRETSTEVPGNGEFDTPLLLDSPETERNLLPFLQLLWSNRRLLFKAALYSAVASTLIALLIPVKYESVTRLMPPDNSSSSGLGLLASLAGGSSGTGSLGLQSLASNVLGSQNTGALFIGIISSQSVQDALIQQFQLKKVYGDSKIEDARDDLAERTDAAEDRKSGIIAITVTDHDPKRAAAMAQAYVSQLDRLVAQVSTSSARRERIFLEGRLEKVKTDLDTAAKNFSDFASKNTAIDIPAQAKAMVEAAAALQGQLIVAQSELSGLQQIYTNDNIRVRSAEARVDELQKKLNEIGGQGTQQELDNDNALYPSIRKLPLLGVTYSDLYRETRIQETVYELLTQQYELAKVQEAKEIPTVKVLDPAVIPTKKSFPPRTLIVILGTFLGLALTTLLLAEASWWKGVEAADPRKVFMVEVFTTVRARLPQFAGDRVVPESNGHLSWGLSKKGNGMGSVNRTGEEHETE